jgi:hypothetical protein
MPSLRYPAGLVRVAATYLVLWAAPAHAVIEQALEFPDAQAIQGATLTLEGSEEVYTGEVREEEGRKEVIFLLPDDSDGKTATVEVVVDGQLRSLSLVVGARTPVLQTSDRASGAAEDGSWFASIGLGVGQVYSDFARRIAEQSARDQDGFLNAQGITNPDPSSNADDAVFAWNGTIAFGYEFRQGGRLSFGLSTSEVDDFKLRADTSGDIPGTMSVITARTSATAELDIRSLEMSYASYFTRMSDFAWTVSVANVSIDRTTMFESTLGVDGVVLDTLTGGDSLDEDVIQYGVGLEWAPRNPRGNWAPTVGLRYVRTGNIEIFDDEEIDAMELFFAFRYRWLVERANRSRSPE